MGSLRQWGSWVFPGPSIALPQSQNSSPGLPDSISGPSPDTKWPLSDMIPKTSVCVFPPPAKETEGKEGWQVSHRPPEPSGSPAPSPLPPRLCPASLCLRAVTSTPARMALGFTQRHFLGDHNTQPCTPRGLLGGSPSVQEHWQERPCLAPAGGEGPRRTEVWPSGTSVGRGQRVHPQGSRREHTCEPPHPRTAPGAASRSSPRPGRGIISPAFHPTFQPRLGPRGTAWCTPPGPGHRAASQAPRPPPCPFCPSGWAAAPRALSGLPMLLLIPRGLSAPRRFWTCSCLWLSHWTPSAQS